MADIVLGIGTSHSPVLSIDYADFPGLADRDRGNPYVKDFDGLVKAKADWIGRELTPDVTRGRHEAAQSAIAQLGAVLADVAPDVLVIVGDDQNEWFSTDGQPALCIYWGDSVDNLPPPLEKMHPVLRSGYWGFYGDGTSRTFPVDAALARHLIETLTHEHEFDVAHLRKQPRHSPFGHAWNFVHQRVMEGRVVPIVPVLLNTYYPPNQPTPARCYALGRAIRHAVEAWPQPKRVGVVASGGLSHFVVDEELDRHVLEILGKKDVAAITTLPTDQLESGNSEIRNWIAAAGALPHLQMQVIDYLPYYRSEAGTGIGAAFAVWR
jgi:catalytic LigB subunit of aromatic ring-opening dioxygenase